LELGTFSRQREKGKRKRGSTQFMTEKVMRLRRYLGCWALVVAISGGWLSLPVYAADDAAPPPARAARDGTHDFDFNVGMWKTHIKRILHPLTGSTDSIELIGTVSVRKVWDGRAQLEEIEADGPKGHWEGLTLFLYNPQSHQWSQTFSNSAAGMFAGSLVGSFKDGRGELYAQDTFDGRSILVRGAWSDVTPTSHRFEEAYSDDGGKTWEPVFIANLTREQP
jgi:hypothetical protein